MKKLIITGGSGFIGTNMVAFYLEKGVEILNLDIAKPLNKKHEPYWKKCNINNAVETKKLFLEFEPTHIMHLAAGIWKDGVDMRINKDIKIDIQTLSNKRILKSLRYNN